MFQGIAAYSPTGNFLVNLTALVKVNAITFSYLILLIIMSVFYISDSYHHSESKKWSVFQLFGRSGILFVIYQAFDSDIQFASKFSQTKSASSAGSRQWVNGSSQGLK